MRFIKLSQAGGPDQYAPVVIKVREILLVTQVNDLDPLEGSVLHLKNTGAITVYDTVDKIAKMLSND
jgi:hypothetical protein